jgi:hypothetical protein
MQPAWERRAAWLLLALNSLSKHANLLHIILFTNSLVQLQRCPIGVYSLKIDCKISLIKLIFSMIFERTTYGSTENLAENKCVKIRKINVN